MKITQLQKVRLLTLLAKKGKSLRDLEPTYRKYNIEVYKDFTVSLANAVIDKLEQLPNRTK